jgi:aquaporin Z
MTCCRRYLAEFIGTLLLVLIGCGSAVIAGSHIGIIGVGLAFGLTLMSLIYIIGPVSGCHINPAVTLGLTFAGKFPLKDVIPYIVMQILGGLAAGYLLFLIASGKVGFDVAAGFATNGFAEYSPDKYSLVSGGIIEVIITAFLVLAVLATTHSSFPSMMSGVFVGITLIAIHLISVPITNTSANIARTIGVDFFQKTLATSQVLYFAIFHFIAAVIAVILFRILYAECCGECKVKK